MTDPYDYEFLMDRYLELVEKFRRIATFVFVIVVLQFVLTCAGLAIVVNQ